MIGFPDLFGDLNSFFEMIADISIQDFVLMMLNGIVMTLDLLPSAVSFFLKGIWYMPSFIVPFVIVTINTIMLFAMIKIIRGG